MSGAICLGPFEDFFGFLLEFLIGKALIFGHRVQGVLLVLGGRQVDLLSRRFVL